MFETKGRTALITGAARRIGRAVALGLAESGMSVLIHYNTSEQAAKTLQKKIKATGASAWLVHADLSKQSEAETLFDRAAELTGTIEVLVNSASIFPASRITDFSIDEFNLNIQINALSPLILSRSFAKQTKTGIIVNFLDSRIIGSDAEHAAYFLSKKTLLEMTRLLALELAPGIRVSAVAPGLILPPPGKDQDYLEKKKHAVPLAAYGDLANITEAVQFLVTNDYITGQVLFVDGGRHLEGGTNV
ncbi:MAG: SDR family oxidoreductase [Deltaproteobacteria bacterium]|nr:SDR family oxidoreductase [Deltaproteobacteria bacterium]